MIEAKSNYNRLICLFLCFVLCFTFVVSPPAHAVGGIAIGIGALVVTVGAALGYIATTSGYTASTYGDKWTNSFESWANTNSYDMTDWLSQVNVQNGGALTIAGGLAGALANYWTDYVQDNNTTNTPVTKSSNVFISNTGVYYPITIWNDLDGIWYENNFHRNKESFVNIYDSILTDGLSLIKQNGHFYCTYDISALNTSTTQIRFIDMKESSTKPNYYYRYSESPLLNGTFNNQAITESVSNKFADNVAEVQTETQTDTSTYVIGINPAVYTQGGDPNDPNNVSDILSALLNAAVAAGIYDYLTGDVVPNTPEVTPSPSPSPEPSPSPSPEVTPSPEPDLWIPSISGRSLIDILKDGIGFDTIWHYVTSWLGSIGSFMSLVFSVWNKLPYAMVVPIYACIVIIIVLGVFRRIFH